MIQLLYFFPYSLEYIYMKSFVEIELMWHIIHPVLFVGNLGRPRKSHCHHFPKILKPNLKAIINNIDYWDKEDFIMIEDPMAHLPIDRLKCAVGDSDVILYFPMSLEGETLGLPVTHGIRPVYNSWQCYGTESIWQFWQEHLKSINHSNNLSNFAWISPCWLVFEELKEKYKMYTSIISPSYARACVCL